MPRVAYPDHRRPQDPAAAWPGSGCVPVPSAATWDSLPAGVAASCCHCLPGIPVPLKGEHWLVPGGWESCGGSSLLGWKVNLPPSSPAPLYAEMHVSSSANTPTSCRQRKAFVCFSGNSCLACPRPLSFVPVGTRAWSVRSKWR